MMSQIKTLLGGSCKHDEKLLKENVSFAQFGQNCGSSLYPKRRKKYKEAKQKTKKTKAWGKRSDTEK